MQHQNGHDNDIAVGEVVARDVLGDNDESDEMLVRNALGLGMPPGGVGMSSLQEYDFDKVFDEAEDAHRHSIQQQQSQPNAVSLSGSKRAAPKQTGLTGRCPKILYLSCDPDHLSQYQCLLRKQIELFEANETDVEAGAQGRNKPIVLGQVGIRCRHCAFIPLNARGRSAVFYPSKLQNVYQASQNIATHHLQDACTHIPDSLKQMLCSLKDQKTRAGYGKEFWAKKAAALGVYDDEDGIRFSELLVL